MSDKKNPIQMKTIHRILTLFAVAFTLYLGATGTLIQVIDLRSIFTHASPFDPNVRAMRESFDGPGDYPVIATSDYGAAPLPAGADLEGMMARVMTAARQSLGTMPLRYAELRMVDGRPVGQVDIGDRLRRFDATTGADMGAAALPPNEGQPPISDRNTFKHLHRMTTFGDWALWINIFVSVALTGLIFTGLYMYARMLFSRAKIGRNGLFWSGGGFWRMLHRWISVVAAAFLVVVTLSGAWLAVESLGFAINMAAAHRPGSPPPQHVDPSSPLKDAELPAMLHTTLAAYDEAMPRGALRVVRLRYYGGMPQGGIVTGEETAHQRVYNAVTGRRVSETEPGYPAVPFPFGWQAHQIAKSIHRGDYFGLTGRFMDLFAGLAMIYLSISGIVMYADLWGKRRKLGRKGLMWN